MVCSPPSLSPRGSFYLSRLRGTRRWSQVDRRSHRLTLQDVHVDLRAGVVVTAIVFESDGNVFAVVKMMKGESAGVAFCAGVLQRVVGAKHE